MPDTRQIILEGSGGQGLGLGGKILAEAAVAGGLNAAQSQSYGAQARGGFSSTEIIISPEEIVYPLVETPDTVVALTPEAYSRHKDLCRRGGLLLYDTEAAQTAEKNRLINAPFLISTEKQHECISGAFGFPFDKEARRLENPKGITLVAIGTLVGLTGIVEIHHFEEAIRDNFTPTVAKTNLKCFWQGLRLARETLKPYC